MPIMQKTKKTSEDKKTDIRGIPDFITPSLNAVKLFGISQQEMELQWDTPFFFSIEPSGIIRQGVSLEMYYKFQHEFTKRYKHVTNR